MKNERPKSIKVIKNFETISFFNQDNNSKFKSRINRNLKMKRLILNQYKINDKMIKTHHNWVSFRESNYPKINQIDKERNNTISKKNKIPNITILKSNFKDKNKYEDEISYKIKNKSNGILSNYQNKPSKIKLIKNRKEKAITISNPYLYENLSKRNRTESINQSSSYSKRELSLIDNPESFLYILFKSSKKFEEDLRKKNIKMKKKNELYEEQRKDFKKSEDEVNRHLSLLNKELCYYEQNKIYGKVTSTKTFMDLKIKLI